VHIEDSKYKFSTPIVSLSQLHDALKRKFELNYEFKITYLDKEFGEFIDFKDIKELPKERAIAIKIERTQKAQVISSFQMAVESSA
jgi:hypothetical protein